MMHWICLVIFCCWRFVAIGQVNLVPNPSFEDTTHCPSTGALDGLDNWSYCGGTPDYYNSCANGTAPQYGVPENWLGFQHARTGNGYIGLATWAFMSNPNREYILIQLNQQLSVGTQYFVSAYIVKADSGDIPPYTCISNNFGFRFSTIQYDFSNPVPTDNNVHVACSSLVGDTLNWFKVGGTFIADSAYTFLMLGNFFDDSNTDTANCDYSLAYAYYYIDDVCVATDSLACEIGDNIEMNATLNSLLIYPNPANNYVKIENIAPGINLSYLIFDAEGRLILTDIISSTNNSINIESLETGAYCLRIGSQTQLIIKTK